MLHKIIYSLWRQLYFLPIICHNAMCRKRLLIPIYDKLNIKHKGIKAINKREDKCIIYSVLPETTFSGGLSDRFRGIVSVYWECKQKGLPFKISFGSMNLTDYLQPNKYDWRPGDGEFDFDTEQSYPCTVLTHHSNINNPIQMFAQRTVLRYYLRKKYRQIHVYTNMATADKEYGSLFSELFKPTHELQQLLDHHIESIGGKKSYNALVFRFRQLLGDFKEGGDIMPEKGREEYIRQCLGKIESEYAKNPVKRLLVTSDSRTFLERVKNFPYVYVIPGEVVHMGFTFDAAKQTYMKSFIDYFMLSYASKVTLIRDKRMYHSGFAYRAALLTDANYSEIWL